MAIKVALFFALAVLAGQSLACSTCGVSTSLNGLGIGGVYGAGCGLGLGGLYGNTIYGNGINGYCGSGLGFGYGGYGGLNGYGLGYGGFNGLGCGGLNGVGYGLGGCTSVVQPAKTCVTQCASTPVVNTVCGGAYGLF